MKPKISITSPLVFDGGVGTELYDRGFYINRPFEELNLLSPRDVIAVHESYIAAGANVLTLNTFSANQPQFKKFDIEENLGPLIAAALQCGNTARRNSGTTRPKSFDIGVVAPNESDTSDCVRLAFSVGPIGELVEPLGSVGLDEARTIYKKTASFALEAASASPEENAFELYILETFTNLSELEAAIDGIRSVDQERPILASISVKSSQIEILANFAERIGGRSDVELLGLNCSEGPSDLLSSLVKIRGITEKPIIIQPNAGTPRHVNGRYFYMTSPDYLAKYAKRFVENGAQGVGGCCGTGPEHIRAIRGAIKMLAAQAAGELKRATPIEVLSPGGSEARAILSSVHDAELVVELKSVLLSKIARGEKAITVEMIPPRGTSSEKFLAGVKLLQDSGVDCVNIPDGARAMTRIGSLHMASFITRETGGKTTGIPHFTTRDRNLIALQSDLLGASLNGVHDLLIVTGDPPKLGNNREATAVYDIDSIGLTYLASCLNRGVSPNGDVLGSATHFGIGVASNPTAINIDLEWKRWNYKVESGAHYAVTQPIFDPDKMKRWLDRISKNHLPHLVGIWPLVSLRNAEFMANEVPGVHIPGWVLSEMEKAGDNRAEAEKRGVEIAMRVMEELAPLCEGFCVSAPLGRVSIALDALTGMITPKASLDAH